MIALSYFGWAATQSASSPSTTPSNLQDLRSTQMKLEPVVVAEPYKFIDGSTRDFAAPTIYDLTVKLFPLAFLWTTAAGLSATHQVDLFMQNSPKFFKSTDVQFVDRLGSGWVKVTASKLDIERSSGQNEYTFHLRLAAPLLLS